jgi:hypothetical protein
MYGSSGQEEDARNQHGGLCGIVMLEIMDLHGQDKCVIGDWGRMNA